jgi:hypothetical protein
MKGKMFGELLVEGKNDRHVILALCNAHKEELPENFEIKTPEDNGHKSGGVEALLESIPVRLKISGLKALGIVVDADTNLQDRWNSICAKLKLSGYENLPQTPSPQGTIISSANKPRVGIWLMPNNELLGILENFVEHLIPEKDPLKNQVDHCLRDMELKSLNLYKAEDRPKALIHTWLAWQEKPGQPMGQAITSKVLKHNHPLALIFVDWLKNTFIEQ